MKTEHPEDPFEKLLHRHLRELPPPSAPPDLIPKVLKRIAARKPLSWWQRPWLEWPASWKVLSSLALAALVWGCWHFTPEITLVSLHAGEWLSGRLHFLKPLFTLGEAAIETLLYLVSAIKPLYLFAAASLIAMAYLGVIGLGSLFYRVTADNRG